MTQSEIDLLITCPKNITTKRFSLRNLDRSLHGVLDAEAIVNEKNFKFKVFFRQSIKLEEKFSVGLKLLTNEDEDINLARYNGIHEHTNKHGDGAIFNTFHKHFATESAILKGIKAEHNAKPANYVNFKGAIVRFFKELNFQNYHQFLKHFDIVENENENSNQLDLGF
jgi:hypothetical protein